MGNLVKERLIEDISYAFKTAKYPGRKIGDENEIMAFIGKKWQEISIDDINSNQSISFFSAAGYYYYLPAYLIMMLKNPQKIDRFVFLGVVRSLANYDTMKIQKQKVCKLFSKKQKDVVLEFLANYEELFFDSTDGLSRGRQKFIERENEEARAYINSAIEYWSKCD
jgi:hypothetical protein